jgi:sugar lactone lactonase YvrE
MKRKTHWIAAIVCLASGLAATRASAGPVDLYVSSFSFGEIYAYSLNGSGSLFIPQSPGLNSVAAMALGPNGNLYVAEPNSMIDEVSLSGNITPFATTGVFAPDAMAFDSFGNLYVTGAIKSDGSFASLIEKITPDGTVSTFSNGANGPLGLAVDKNNNLFVANFGDNSIDEITPGGTETQFASGLSSPAGLAFDADGNLFVSNVGNNTIDEFTPGGLETQFATGTVDEPAALAFDPDGNLYVTGGLNDPIDVYTPSGQVSQFAVLPDASQNPQPDALVFAPAPVPAPEPASLSVFAAGLLALRAMGSRSRSSNR